MRDSAPLIRELHETWLRASAAEPDEPRTVRAALRLRLRRAQARQRGDDEPAAEPERG